MATWAYSRKFFAGFLILLMGACSAQKVNQQQEDLQVAELRTHALYDSLLEVAGGEAENQSNLQNSDPPSVNPAYRLFFQTCERLYAENTPHERNQLFSVVYTAAQQHQVEDELVLAVIAVESQCNADARSHSGATGLMQLMPDTAKALGVKDPYSVRDNVHGGTKYLASLIKRFEGDVKLALAAYHSGPRAVERNNGKDLSYYTRYFVGRVMAHYRSLQGLSMGQEGSAQGRSTRQALPNEREIKPAPKAVQRKLPAA